MARVNAECVHDRSKDALDGGVGFLVSRQGMDGLWRDFFTPAGEASTWPSAYIGAALQIAAADPDALERAADALVRRQQPDGGWGYNEATPSDADSTSWAVLFLTGLQHRPQFQDACRHAGAFLNRHQRRTGGVATYAEPASIRQYMGLPNWMPFWGWCRPQIEVSAAAGRAQYALSTKAPLASSVAAWRYVRSRQKSDGSWDSYWWTSPHVATQQSVAFALVMHDQDPIRRAVAWALRGQRRDGGWETPGWTTASALATALSLSVLAAAEVVDRRSVCRGIDALIRIQQDDGGWPSRPELRIPLPVDRGPARDDRWRPIRFDAGMVVADQHRTFTSATCVAALAEAQLRLRIADMDGSPPAAP